MRNGKAGRGTSCNGGQSFINLAQQSNFFLTRSCAVFSKEGKAQERWLLEFVRQPAEQASQTQLHIMGADGYWTEEYKALTREFYLNF